MFLLGSSQSCSKSLFTALLLISLSALGDCNRPRIPSFPNSEAATLPEIETAQAAMQKYVKATEDYLDCLTEDQREQEMDGVLAEMKGVTGEYNTLMVSYRKRRANQLFSEGSR